MTSKKNMRTNRTPRRIHRNKGGRKKGYNYGAADDEFGAGFISEPEFNKRHKKALKDAEPSGIKRRKKKYEGKN